MHLVEIAGRQILLDCGLLLERGPEARERNRVFPFDPYRIEAVILSHAHIDHCGNLANLVRQGFAGPIFCTPPTRDLIGLMLADSARIQEEDAVQANVARQADEPCIEPLYTRQDVRRTVELCVPVPFDEPRTLNDFMQFRLLDAGHILGSAIVALTFAWSGREYRLTFTGDLGRPGLPLLHDPAPLPAADVVLSECTYGGSTHEPIACMAEAMRVLVRQTAARGGKVLVPTFSLGRSQLIVHFLQELMKNGQLPQLPVFVDSPLAADIAQVYRHHLDYMRPAAARSLQEDINFLQGPHLNYLRTMEESKQLNTFRDPCVIVASSGMVEGGRIVHHLKHHVDDPRSTVILVSYQTPGSLGSRLLERGPTVRLHGREFNKWLDVVVLKGFSGHADHHDLLASLGPLVECGPRLRLVHGEPGPAETLAQALRGHGFGDVALAEYASTVELA
jgi:metallo-beta-lactamase family protein